MKTFNRIVLWSLVFFALLAGADQFLVRVPASVSGWREIRTFYLDFRSRLLSLSQAKEQTTVEKLIDRAQTPVRPVPSRPAQGPGFLYMDAQGALQFVDSLEEVPAALRSQAQRLER